MSFPTASLLNVIFFAYSSGQDINCHSALWVGSSAVAEIPVSLADNLKRVSVVLYSSVFDAVFKFALVLFV